MLPYKQIISEAASNGLDRHLKHLEDFLDEHGGTDLVRWLHSKEVEIVAHTSGAILKVYRTEEDFDPEDPEKCWRFWAGRYEIDINEIDPDDPIKSRHVGKAPGFTHRDYFYAIRHILEQHKKDGEIKKIRPRTLILLQVDGTEEIPDVRMYRQVPRGRSVVVGVKYEVEPQWVQATLRLHRPGEITQLAIEKQRAWESHAELQKVADFLKTDTLPIFFRGNLSTADSTIEGMRKSAGSDRQFRQFLGQFFSRIGKRNPTEEDYQQFFRRVLNQMGNIQINRISHDEKVEDATAITKQDIQRHLDRAYSRFDQVESNISSTIEQHGHGSQEHMEDYRDLSYLKHWLKNEAGKIVFGDPNYDPVTNAIVALQNAEQRVTKDRVLSWVRRELEEQGWHQHLYRLHLKDTNVPQGRHANRTKLWESFLKEVGRMINERVDDLNQAIADAGR